MGGIETAGDLAQGALVARAVEPNAGEGDSRPTGVLCLNCGTRLIGEHCHSCGQSGHVHRTAGAIGHELAHGVFHFEGKIWRTLPMLAFRPGELTRRYVDGERARFVSPLALFLFSVFLMFAVLANLPGKTLTGMDDVALGGDFDQARVEVADELLKTRAAIARHERLVAEARRASEPEPALIRHREQKLAEARRDARALGQAQRYLPAPDGARADEGAPDNWLEAKYRQATANPKLLIYKLKTTAYKYSWALIPISLPFIWLLFPLRRDVGFYDHAVFATYSLAFMSLFAILVAVLAFAGVGGGLLGLAATLIPPIHLYKQLKGAYRLRRSGALWRTAWMLAFAVMTSTLFILLLLTVGVSG